MPCGIIGDKTELVSTVKSAYDQGMFDAGKRKGSLLLVDDNHQVADGLRKFFSYRGAKTQVEYSAAGLRNRFSESAPRAVVLDINLRDGNGIELIAEIRNAWPGVPVVMLTGLGYDTDLMNKAKALGAQGYVSKNVPPDQLLASVLGILEHPEHH